MSDISDLHGVFPTPLRWNAEAGVLGYGKFDGATGERTVEEIPLGSAAARFALDLATRERGYGLIRAGVYDMRLTPVGSPPPPWPGDEFKPAVGCWLWNPAFGELRCETNATLFREAIDGVWERAKTFKEAAEGQQPIIYFYDRRERPFKEIGKAFWAPQIDIINWIARDRLPPFALRAPTVKPPMALDSQVRHALLEHLRPKGPVRAPAKTKRGGPPKRASLEDFLDDELPENL
jgi:hypothetical protein